VEVISRDPLPFVGWPTLRPLRLASFSDMVPVFTSICSTVSCCVKQMSMHVRIMMKNWKIVIASNAMFSGLQHDY
jgi:hypothetical protein